jgi:lipopolysaccharide/colanic/teichoic acid biosynthesis glycosyltransferase
VIARRTATFRSGLDHKRFEESPFSIHKPASNQSCLLPRGSLESSEDSGVNHFVNRPDRPLPRFLKRSFYIALSGAALFLLSPLLLIVALVVKLDGGPVFYAQQRLGRGGKVFKCLKFRSMVVDGDSVFQKYLIENPEAREEWERYRKLRNDARVTRGGALLRR